jgi:sigma-B regulation protein RsbU (phosphoserine phosphatase)
MHGYLDLPSRGERAARDAGETSRVLLSAIQTTNQYIAVTHPRSSMFASVFFGLLDPASGVLQYINAGHESPVIFRQDGQRDVLEVNGGVLGLFSAARFSVAQAQLRGGDLLFAYSDGVNEAKSPSDAQFGEDRIHALPAPWPSGAADFLEAMQARIVEFRDTAPQSDDITMLAVKRLVEA